MYIFLHIAKAGGTSIRHMFAQAFGRRKLLLVSGSMANARPDYLNVVRPSRFRDVRKINRFRAVAGHLSMEQIISHPEIFQMRSDNKPIIFTSVRDPIDRMISVFNFALGTKEHPKHDAAQSSDAFEFLMNLPENYQSERLGFGDIFGDLPALFSNVNCLPLDRSTQMLKQYLEQSQGKPIGEQSPKNVTSQRYPGLANRFVNRDSFSLEQLERLQERHRKDITLYTAAQEKSWTSFVALKHQAATQKIEEWTMAEDKQRSFTGALAFQLWLVDWAAENPEADEATRRAAWESEKTVMKTKVKKACRALERKGFTLPT